MQLPEGFTILYANANMMALFCPGGTALLNNDVGWHGKFERVSITPTHVFLEHKGNGGVEYAVVTRSLVTSGVIDRRSHCLQGPMTKVAFDALGTNPKKWIKVQHPWHWIPDLIGWFLLTGIVSWCIRNLFTARLPTAASCDQTS